MQRHFQRLETFLHAKHFEQSFNTTFPLFVSLYTINVISTLESNITHSRPQRIYLNGFMGCGKSTVGPRLAERLGWAFFDLDDRIVSTIKMPISTYFSEAGEPAFRRVEQQALHRSNAPPNCVIAVGGGALCSQENLNWAKAHGVVVYLQVSVDALIARLKAGQTTRPMLLGKSGQLLSDNTVRSRISGLLEQRTSFYEQSHVTVKTDGLSVEEVVEVVSLRVGGSESR